MRFLVDTHFVIWLVEDGGVSVDRRFRAVLDDPANDLVASVVSVWEIAIKARLGKLTLRVPPASVPDALRVLGLDLLAIDENHVLAEVAPEPETRDPFDRLLLAQCRVEGLRLITADRALADHPLAWR